jgi:hypothetical protein
MRKNQITKVLVFDRREQVFMLIVEFSPQNKWGFIPLPTLVRSQVFASKLPLDSTNAAKPIFNMYPLQSASPMIDRFSA